MQKNWPTIAPECRPRPLYYREDLPANEVERLKDLGYDPIDIIMLPRRTEQENLRYLLAKAQAIEEGTIVIGSEERRQLELSMQCYGMLNSKSTKINVNVDMNQDSLDQILNWQSSRHTMRGNTTIVSTMDKLRDSTAKQLMQARARAADKLKIKIKPQKTKRAKNHKKTISPKKTRGELMQRTIERDAMGLKRIGRPKQQQVDEQQEQKQNDNLSIVNSQEELY